MKILVLGSRGRAPCRQCVASTPAARPPSSRLPGAVAVAGSEDRWLLLNAARDMARHGQIEAAAAAGRIAGVVLLDAQPLHAESLAELARGQPLDVYATPVVFEELSGSLPLLGPPGQGCSVRWHLLPVAGDVRSSEFRVDGLHSLRLVAIDDGGWAAPYSPHRQEAVVGDSITLFVEDRLAGQRLIYTPGAGGANAAPWMEGADCLLVGGETCPLDHCAASAGGDLASIGARRTVLVHLNDCDPRLHAGSDARRAVDAAGIEIAYDGMEILL